MHVSVYLQTVFNSVWFTHYPLCLTFNFFILGTYDSRFYLNAEDDAHNLCWRQGKWKQFLEWHSSFPRCTNVVHSFPITRKLTARFPVIWHSSLTAALLVCVPCFSFKHHWMIPMISRFTLANFSRARLTFIHGHTSWKHTEPPSVTIRLCLQYL